VLADGRPEIDALPSTFRLACGAWPSAVPPAAVSDLHAAPTPTVRTGSIEVHCSEGGIN
jgi:hypothetical protein